MQLCVNIYICSKVLTGMLALLLSMSTHKSTILLHKLDVSLLGGNSDAKVQGSRVQGWIQGHLKDAMM